VASTLTLLGLVVGENVAGATSSTVSTTYQYSSTALTWTVPANVTSITVDILGGRGSLGGRDSSGFPPDGGYQGEVSGTLSVYPGQVLTIAPGQAGQLPTNTGCSPGTNLSSPYTTLNFDSKDAKPGVNALGGNSYTGLYAGGYGGSPGPSGCSGYGGAGGAASVLELGSVSSPSSDGIIIAGGSGGSGGSGQFTANRGQPPLSSYSGRSDAVTTNGQNGISVANQCHAPNAANCDGGGGAGGGGGAQGGAQGLVPFGSTGSNEWFGLGGSPGQNSTGGFAGLAAQYTYYPTDGVSGQITITYNSGVPGPVSGFSATTPSGGCSTLNWTAPAITGLAPITGYEVQEKVNGGSWTDVTVNSNSVSTSYQVCSLSGGSSYAFQVAAINSYGTGNYPNATSAPQAPTLGSPTMGDGYLSIPLTLSGAGSTTITGYQFSIDGGTTWQTATQTTPPIIVSGLTNGTSYSVKVRSYNDWGWTLATNTATGTPFGVPSIIQNSTITFTTASGTVTLNWSAPSANGSAITYYYVGVYNAATYGSTVTSCQVSVLTCTFNGLSNNTTYYFTIQANNAAGLSTRSNPRVGVTVAGNNPPSSPSGVTANPGDQKVTLNWSAPANNGSAITGYGVQYSSNGGTTWTTFAGCTDASTTCVVTGLTNNVQYSFQVNATNAIGSSLYAVPVTATPFVPSAPNTPTNVRASSNLNQSSIVSWSQTSNGGSSITATDVQYSTDGGTTWVDATMCATVVSTSCTVTGLTNGTSYVFQVTTTNAIGTSSFSAVSTVAVPATTPSAPNAFAATSGDNAQSVLTWTAPTTDGGANVTSYTVTSATATIPASCIATISLTCTVTGLTNGTTYTFSITASNGAGIGAASTTTATPSTTPSSPVIAPSSLPTNAVFGGSFTAVVTQSTGNGALSVLSNTTTICTVGANGLTVTFTGAGTCSLSAHSAATSSYHAATGTAQTFVISQATPTTPVITPTPPAAQYGTTYTPVVSTNGDGVKSVTSSTTSVCVVNAGVVSYLSLGTCTLTAHVAAGTNYGAADGTAQSFYIGQGTPTPPTVSDVPAHPTYGSSFLPVVSTSGDGATSLVSTTPSVCAINTITNVVTFVGVGTCTLKASVAAGQFYNALDAAQNFTVYPAVLTVTASSATMSFGSPPPTLTPIISGFVNGDPTTVVTVLPTCSTVATSASHPGNYASSCTGGSTSADYTFVSDGSNYVAGLVTVQPAAPTMPIITNVPSHAVYGGTFTGPVVTTNSPGATSITSATPNVCSVVTVGSAVTVSFVSASSNCELIAHVASSTDYAAANNYGQYFWIFPATLTITPTSATMIFGGTPPTITPTYSGFVGSDAAGSGALSIAPTCSTWATSLSNPGSYGSSCTGAFAPNYSIIYANGSFTVTLAQASAPTISNLPLAAVMGVSFTPSVSTTGDGVTSVTSSTPLVCTVSGTGVVSYVATGTCTLVAHVATGAQFSSNVSGALSFTVGQGQASVPTITNVPTSATYGASYTAVVSTTGDGATSVSSTSPGVCRASGLAVTFVSPGICILVAHVVSSSNYLGTTGPAQNFTVTPATLTVTAASPSITFGASVPAITYTVSGYVNGQNASVILAAPTCTSTAKAHPAGGTYVTSCSGAGAINYVFTYVAGALTVGLAVPTTPTITNLPAMDTYDNTYVPTFATNADGDLVLTSSTTSVCEVDPATNDVIYVGVGTCTLIPGVDAGTSYAAVTGSPVSYTVAYANTSAAVTYGSSDWWGNGYNSSITLTDSSPLNVGTPDVPWTFSFVVPTGTSLSNLWGADYATSATVGGTLVTVTALADTPVLYPGQSVTIGFTTTGPDAVTDFLMGGVSSLTSPTVPTGITATQSSGTATVTWTTPTSWGSGVAFSYVVSVVGASWRTCTLTGATLSSNSCTFTGLTNGTNYTFVVRAINSAGVSSSYSAASNTVMPVGIPDAPSILYVAVSGTNVIVTLGAPYNTGGVPLTGFTVTAHSATGTIPLPCVATGLVCTFTGLTDGASYTFTATTTNAVPFTSAASAASGAVLVFEAPGTVTITSVATSSQSATITWSAPTVLGGSFITGYIVTASPGGNDCYTTTTSCAVVGLSNGTAYTFSVTAITAAGYASTISTSSTSTPLSAPSAPVWVHATAGNESVLVAWLAPHTNGGSPITSYTVTANASGVTLPAPCTTTALTCTFTGLTDNVAYTFTVTATSLGGTSVPSSSSTPSTPQSATQSASLHYLFVKSLKWPGGYSGQYAVSNRTPYTIGSRTNRWTFSFKLPVGTTLSNLWNASYTTSLNAGVTTVTVTAPLSAPSIAAGAAYPVYFNVIGTGSPNSCTAAGSSCTP
jgi:titin